jgi:hypothetical protein
MSQVGTLLRDKMAEKEILYSPSNASGCLVYLLFYYT